MESVQSLSKTTTTTTTSEEINSCLNDPQTLLSRLATLSEEERGELLNSQSSASLPPLHFAAFNGNVQATEILLAAGADPNYCASQPELTPLMCACDQGSKDRTGLTHCKVAKSLVEAGAKVDAYGVDGFTPLLFATDDGSLEIVELLLNHCLLYTSRCV